MSANVFQYLLGSISKYLDPLCDFAFQVIGHKVLKHKTPTKLLSFSFVFLGSHKVSVEDKTFDLLVGNMLN